MNTELSTIPAIDVLVNDWHMSMSLRVSAGELAENTVVLYKRGMKKYLEFLPSAQTDEPLREWKAELLTAYKPRTINAWMAGPRAFFVWAKSAGRLLDDPAASVPLIKPAKGHERDVFMDSEVVRVLAIPDPDTAAGRRDAAILSLMAYASLRTVEIHRANFEDIQTRSGRMVLRIQGKGHIDSDAMVVINQHAESYLIPWITERGNREGPLFTSLSRRNLGGRLSLSAIRAMVKKYLRIAGINSKRKTAHSFRHTAITKMIRQKLPPTKIMSVSRHERLDTLMIYVHDVERLEDPAEDYIDYVDGG